MPNQNALTHLNELEDSETYSGKCGYHFGLNNICYICNRPAGHPGKHIERVTVEPETNLDLIQIEGMTNMAITDRFDMSDPMYEDPSIEAQLDAPEPKHTTPPTGGRGAETVNDTVTVTIPKGIAGYMFDHAEGEIDFWQEYEPDGPEAEQMAADMLKDWKLTLAALGPLVQD